MTEIKELSQYLEGGGLELPPVFGTSCIKEYFQDEGIYKSLV